MVDVRDVRKKLHDMSNAITVVESFILRFDPNHTQDDMLKELHEASQDAIKRIKDGFESAYDVVLQIDKS